MYIYIALRCAEFELGLEIEPKTLEISKVAKWSLCAETHETTLW